MEPEVRHKPVRYYEIDLLRFIAAISVVLYHFTFRGYYADDLSPVYYGELGEIFKYGYLGVELFFIISGYVVLMSSQGKTLAQFFTSRVMRLYPAFWVACTLTFIVVRLFGPAVHAPGWSPMLDAPLRGYVFSMTMLHGFFGVADIDGVYWTLTVELSFYFLIALLISFNWMRHLTVVLALWLAYCALVGPASPTTPFSILLFPGFAPFFVAGMVFYMLQTKQAPRWQLYILLGVSYLLSLRTVGTGLPGTIDVFHHAFSLPIVLGLITVFYLVFLGIVLRWLRLGQSKWLAWAGTLTYPIYLLHHNMGYIVFQRVGNSINRYVLLGAMLVAVLVLAYLLHVLVERRYANRFGQWLRGQLARA